MHSQSTRGHTDTGVSLLEVIIAMTLSTLILGGFLALALGMIDTTRLVKDKDANTQDGIIAAESMSRALRVAAIPPEESSALLMARENEVTFYSRMAKGTHDGSLPLRITFGYDATEQCITETVVPPVVVDGATTWPQTGAITKCLGPAKTPPEFTYHLRGAHGQLGLAVTLPEGGITAPTAGQYSCRDVADERNINCITGITFAIAVDRVEDSPAKASKTTMHITLGNVLAAMRITGV